MDECPSISETIFGRTPFVSRSVAQVCLRSWQRTVQSYLTYDATAAGISTYSPEDFSPVMEILPLVGMALLLVGFALFVVDLSVANHGLPTAGGILALLAGGLALLWAGVPYSGALLGALGILAVLMGGMLLGVLGSSRALKGRAALTGKEGSLDRASSSSSLVCTDSTLVSDLMSSRGGSTDLANLALQFQVPTLSRATTTDLMDARVNHGEAFHNFRVALERELRGLRHIEDPEERGRKLEEVRHEFEVVQLNQVRTEIERIKRNLIGEGMAGAASMSAVLYSPQATILGLLAAAFAAGSTSLNYYNQIRTHPAYFLWRVSRGG